MLTSTLARPLLEEIGDSIRQHGVVVWLDKDGHYTELVDELAAQSEKERGFAVVPFRGSYLETMLALEPYGSDLHPERLLIHMPGHNETSVRGTPLLELYEIGYRFRKALSTLVEQGATGVLDPAEVRELSRRPDLTLKLAEQVLAERLGQRSEGLDATLERMELHQVAESVLGVTGVALTARTPADFAALRAYLHRQTGFDAAWAERAVGSMRPAASGGFEPASARNALRDGFGAWLLLLEFVHDLERPPRTARLIELRAVPKELVKRCHEVVLHLRQKHPEQYAQLANELEPLVDEETQEVRAEELGRIDTFAFEERIVLTGAIAALRRGEWARVLAWAKDRAGEASFWLSRDRRRRWTWMVAEEVAALGMAIDAAPRPLEGASTLDDAVERYRATAFRVDRAHRLFEQRWHELRAPELPHWDELLGIVEVVRRLYRDWADRLARDFTALCEREGFLPDAPLQQRTFFDQVVRPLTQEPEPVAVFVLDALRYEMAEALAEDMRRTGGVTVDLRARLAELPTLTAVGMNALAPVAREGRLDVVTTNGGSFRGFRSGSFAVLDPQSRARAMGERAIGESARLVKLDEVIDAPRKRLHEWVKKGPKLIVVHGLEIDDAGEAGFGLGTFEHTLRQVQAAWHHLSTAGVKTFVFTADHGFLLQDATTTVQPYGKKTDPARRYVLHDQPVRESGTVPVSLAKLGYESASGYLLLREDTAVYDTGRGASAFVHGGNSLQERVIPVMVVKRRRGPGQSASAYVLEAQVEKPAMGNHRLRLRVQLGRDVIGSLGFAGPQSVRLAMRAVDRPDVAVRVRDVVGNARLRAGGLDIAVGAEWTEVFFVLEGPADERVRIEVHHPDRIENVEPLELAGYFEVVGVGAAVVTRSEPPPSAEPSAMDEPPARVLSWKDAIEDEDFRGVFEKLEKSTSLSEADLLQSIGPRKARMFARQFDVLLSKLPFRVRIEVHGSQKVYVKDGGR